MAVLNTQIISVAKIASAAKWNKRNKVSQRPFFWPAYGLPKKKGLTQWNNQIEDI